MTSPTLLCTDGSDLSIEALRAGLALLAPGTPAHLVTVMHEPDPMLVTGSGIAGGVMSPDTFDLQMEEAAEEAERVMNATASALGLETVESHVLRGPAGPAICTLADEVDAAAIVIGTRGRGGLKRAVLGSVSDHVVRHAPCPVIVTNDHSEHDEA